MQLTGKFQLSDMMIANFSTFDSNIYLCGHRGTTIAQVYAAMSSISFPPFSVFPEYVKGGGGGGSGDDDTVPSSDVTLIVSIVEEFGDNSNYSLYEQFLSDLFSAMDAVNGGPCMDDHDTDPHVSISRGVKFKSSYHQEQYFYSVNLEVAVWQAMYPNGVIIGSSTKVNFPPENYNKNRRSVRYGSLYFFFDRANITMPFSPNRNLYDSEVYYSTLAQSDTSVFYSGVKKIGFNYAGSGSKNNNKYYEHNPYAWNAAMAMHDMTDGWDLPPNCDMEGETFLGIPLSRKSASKLQSTGTFQDQFDFEYLVDRNFTYIKKFGTNHGWLVGEAVGNAAGSLVDKDTSHIPIFYTGTTNPKMGGIALSDIIKVVKLIDFGTLYIKPAFLFQDDDGAVKLQFEADASSALGYLYDNLCKMLGLSWNYESPSNKYGVYTNCAMHAAGDRASYGCGPGNGNKGGFCPQLTVGYRVKFQSEDHAAAFFARGNNYVDYWRSLYPNGVAVGTDSFCPKGGCLGLFLNRYDLYEVFKPNLGGSWVEYNGGTFAPTISPAPTLKGGCSNKYNQHLDRCAKRFSSHHMKASSVAWNSLGGFGQLSIFLVSFMAATLSISLFLARAKKRRRKGESYYDFMMRDWNRGSGRGRKKKKKSRRSMNRGLDEDLLGVRPPSERARSRSKSRSHPTDVPSSRRSSSRHLPIEDEIRSRSSFSRHAEMYSSGLIPIDNRSRHRNSERDISMRVDNRSSSLARNRDESGSIHRSSSRSSSRHCDSSSSKADDKSSSRSASSTRSRRESSVSRSVGDSRSSHPRRQLV
jgi:hypothetical protein